MTSTPTSPSPAALAQPRAASFSFTDGQLVLELRDGRQLRVPVRWFPPIASLEPAVRDQAHLIGDGAVLAWQASEFEEHLSVPALLGLPDV